METKNAAEPLARTLASLVAAAVEGVVREVIVCDLGSTDHTRDVADQTGCLVVSEGGVGAGIRRAKSEWLLFLEPGARLVDGWAEHVADHTADQAIAARFARARADPTPFLARVLSPRRPLAEGLLVSRRQATALVRDTNEAGALARGLATKRLLAEIMVAAPR